MLFRHMFYCKHVERLLCNVWISNKESKQYSLHSAKWWEPTGIQFSTDSLRLCSVLKRSCQSQVCRRFRIKTADAQLRSEHSVLHDVWGDGAHVARHGEQPEVCEFITFKLPLLLKECRRSRDLNAFNSLLVFRRPTSMTCCVITPAFWITVWRTACSPTPSCSASSPNSCPSAWCSPTACRYEYRLCEEEKRWCVTLSSRWGFAVDPSEVHSEHEDRRRDEASHAGGQRLSGPKPTDGGGGEEESHL